MVPFDIAKARVDKALDWLREVEAAIEEKKQGLRQNVSMAELQDELDLAQHNYTWMMQHASDESVDWNA